MKNLWQLQIELEREGYNSGSLNYKVDGVYSPYGEVSLLNLNKYIQKSEDLREIDVNPFYRYACIFNDFLTPDKGEFGEARAFTVDIILHHLALIDGWSGMNKQEFYIFFIARDLEDRYADEFNLFSNDEKFFIANQLFSLYVTGVFVNSFAECMKEVFKNCFVGYTERDNLIVFINLCKTDINSKKFEFIKNVFLRLDIACFDYWGVFPAVLGIDELCVIGECVVF